MWLHSCSGISSCQCADAWPLWAFGGWCRVVQSDLDVLWALPDAAHGPHEGSTPRPAHHVFSLRHGQGTSPHKSTLATFCLCMLSLSDLWQFKYYAFFCDLMRTSLHSSAIFVPTVTWTEVDIHVCYCSGDWQRSFISGYNALLSLTAAGSEPCKYSG